MDRNGLPATSLAHRENVALRKESVDRNFDYAHPGCEVISSLSARRAWLEMVCVGLSFPLIILSLSARRAWIEMLVYLALIRYLVVALRKESVDRNMWWGVRKAVGSLVALRKESVDRNHYAPGF